MYQLNIIILCSGRGEKTSWSKDVEFKLRSARVHINKGVSYKGGVKASDLDDDHLNITTLCSGREEKTGWSKDVEFKLRSTRACINQAILCKGEQRHQILMNIT